MVAARVPNRRNNICIAFAASDTPSQIQSRADYVFGATENIATVVTAYLDKGIRVFYFAEGTYVAQDVPIREGLTIYGAGKRDSGASVGGTRFNFPSSPGSGAMFKADTLSVIDGGSIQDIYVQGNGSITTKSDWGTSGTTISTPAGNCGTLDAFDFGAVTTLEHFSFDNVRAYNFRRVFNGATTNNRFIPITRCDWWLNHTAVYSPNGHPNFNLNDFRYNYIAIGGNPYDLLVENTKINYCIYGALKTSGGTAEGLDNFTMLGGSLYSNDYGVILNAKGLLESVFIATGGTAGITGVIFLGGYNSVKNCTFRNDTAGTGWTDACVQWAGASSTANTLNSVSGCHLENRDNTGGTIFSFDASDGRMTRSNITGNTFRITNGQIIAVPTSTTNWMTHCNWSGNVISVESFGTSTDPLIFLQNSTNKCNLFTNNCFFIASGVTLDSLIEGYLLSSYFLYNTIENDGTLTNGALNLTASTGSTITPNIEV